MPKLRVIWHKLRGLFKPSPSGAEFDEEARTHLAMLAERFERSGLTPEAARREARWQFGSTVAVSETRYEMQTFAAAEGFWRDLRYAVRLLRLNPLFALTAVVSLGLGIGANTAIFQLIDSVRLRSLPVKDPQQLARVAIVGGNTGLGINNQYGDLTRPIWDELRRTDKSFSGMFAWGSNQYLVPTSNGLKPVQGLDVTGSLFPVLGVDAWRGRLLLPDDEHACPATTAVVSYAYWRTKMGAPHLDSATKLLVDRQPVQVVGVTPPEFLGLAVGDHFDIALPFCRPAEGLQRNVFDLTVMGRLRPGVSLESASAELSALSPGIMDDTAPTGYASDAVARYRAFRLAAYPARTGVSSLSKEDDSSLSVLLSITGLVLLIACANLANLILARASARERELGVRLALGASRRRLLRQLLAENALLAAIGGAVAIGVAQVVSRLIVHALSTEGSTVQLPLGIDWRVLAFTVAVAALTCVIFGAIPAVRAAGIQPLTALRSGRGIAGSSGRTALQRLLVTAQITVSLILLVAALLFVRSFYNLMTFNPGMREHGVTAAFIGFAQSNIPKDRYLNFQKQLVDELRGIPGVLSAAETTNPPLLGGSWTHTIQIGAARGESKFTWVGPEYFKTMDITILQGRSLSPTDTANSTRVAVVNQTFVRQFVRGDPIGLSLRTAAEPDYPSTVYTIVGVIPDTKYACLRCGTPPMAFAPASQFPARHPWTAIMIYSRLPSETISAEVDRLLTKKHPEVAVQVSSFEQLIRDGLVRDRLMALLSGFFGLLAAVLAAVGLYGVTAYTASQRRSEIGVRIALGAARSQVIALIIQQAFRMVLAGILLGVLAALVVGRAAQTLLFDLKPYDPLTLFGAAILLIGIGLLASLVPAYRASRLDPTEALRCE